MEVHEFDVTVHPKFGLGALLTLRAIDFSSLNDPEDQDCVDTAETDKDDVEPLADSSSDEHVDPFDPDNTTALAVDPTKRRLQVDKLQPGGSCEKAGVCVGDVVLRIRQQGKDGGFLSEWKPITSHRELKHAYQDQVQVRIAVARDKEFAAAVAAADIGAVAAAAASPVAGSWLSGGPHGQTENTGLSQAMMMSQVESEAEQRTKELLDSGKITQEEFDAIVAKTRERRAEQQRALKRAEAIRQGNVIVEAMFGKGSPLGITLHTKGDGCVLNYCAPR